MTAKGTRAAIYARLSKDKARGSDAEGLGVTRQEAACRSLAASRGWAVVKVYTDNDLSAWSGGPRPAYDAMLADAKQGRFDHIVAWAPDRLNRDLAATLEFAKTIGAAGVQAHTVTSGQVGSESENEFISTVLQGMLGQVESDRRSKRLREKMLEKARNGEAHGGTRGYGYTLDMTVIPEEASVIRDAAGRLLAGEGLASVVNDLNRRGVPAASGKVGAWTTSTLKTIMCSPRIAGLRRHESRPRGERNSGGLYRAGDLYPAQWDAIITQEHWERLRRRLDGPNRKTVSPARSYLLSGLLVCGREGCGGRLVGYRYADGTRGYACKSGTRGCGRCTIKAEAAESFVERAVREAIANTEQVGEAVRAASEDDDDLSQVRTRIRSRLADRAALDQDLTTGRIDYTRWQTIDSGIGDDLASLYAERDRLEQARDRIEWDSDRWTVEWDLDDSTTRRAAMLRTVVEFITVGSGRPGRGSRVDDRLDIRWF